jgi:hypothetical protein
VVIAMVKQPNKVVLRAYNVGFGDCFLLSFQYAGGDARHVLIDFGTTKLPNATKPKATSKKVDWMRQVAEQIRADCGGKLHVVVATHRHKDHISGFSDEGKDGGTGKIIRDCKPDLVVQPWTEDPEIPRNAKSSPSSTSLRASARFAARLANLHTVSAAALAASNAPHLRKTVREQLAFLGEDNLANLAAVKNLQKMGKAGRAVYARYGTDLKIGSLLPGVDVEVLGPPDLTQTTAIEKMTAKDPSEFWHLAARTLDQENGHVTVPVSGKRPSVPPHVRWFRARLDHAQGESLLELVRSLDEEMNNTSLILLFTVRGKKLLFPGDAQLENWSYALGSKEHGAKNQKLLAGVDLYKVGHHGSLNATPKTLLWENFAKRGSKSKAGRLETVVSTLRGKHGSEARGTEVPRGRLVDELEAHSDFKTTEGLKGENGAPGVVVREIPLT